MEARVGGEAALDRDVLIDDSVAINTARALAHKEGIFCGISSGATFAAALEIARDLEPGSAVLAMLPDTGERYLSTPLFEGVLEGSDDEWLALVENGSPLQQDQSNNQGRGRS